MASFGKGHSFPAASFDLSPEWVGEYVAAVEDGAIGGLGEGIVPPMAVAALSVRALLQEASLPPGSVHAAQELRFHRIVRTGERLGARADVVSRGERAGWVLMGIELTVEDASGEPMMTGRATLSFPVGDED